MENKFDFINIQFDNYTLKDVLNKLEEYIASGGIHRVFTPNAELIVRAYKNQELRQIYNETDIVTIDSWVVYYAARLLGKPLTEPVSAANIMFHFLPVAAEKGYKIYLLGAAKEVVEKVEQNLKQKYSGIKIVGRHDGYFDKDNPQEIIDDIKAGKPDILFVAMSTPFKENFIVSNMSKLNVPVSIGVGGSFDIIAGYCTHAPLWISKLGLEWFYRFIQEPRRMWKRYLITNTIFIFLWIKELFNTLTPRCKVNF